MTEGAELMFIPRYPLQYQILRLRRHDLALIHTKPPPSFCKQNATSPEVHGTSGEALNYSQFKKSLLPSKSLENRLPVNYTPLIVNSSALRSFHRIFPCWLLRSSGKPSFRPVGAAVHSPAEAVAAD